MVLFILFFQILTEILQGKGTLKNLISHVRVHSSIRAGIMSADSNFQMSVIAGPNTRCGPTVTSCLLLSSSSPTPQHTYVGYDDARVQSPTTHPPARFSS